MATVERNPDVVLVGAGFANSLIALELARSRPDLTIVVIEPLHTQSVEQHTWCVFETDMSATAWQHLAGRFERIWPRYRVMFPKHKRELSTRYACLTSAGLRQTLIDTGITLLDARVKATAPTHAVLDDDQQVSANTVIDGRGASSSANILLGFQKFIGLEVVLRKPHGVDCPIVMDATVRQLDGYRFLYVLPLDADRLLIEDTRYSDNARLDVRGLEAAVLRYGRGQSWSIARITRRERGVLPVALDGDARAYFAEAGREAPQVGMRGLFFHPTTGYSFPDATRVAELVTANIDLGGARLATLLRQQAIKLWDERAFYRLLNRMLFRAACPSERYRVLEQFYRLPQPLIERFYAGRTTFADKARVLSGKPPVPLWRALKAAWPARSHPVHASY